MTGSEIAKAIKAHRGKVSVRAVLGDDSPYLFAEKQSLFDHFQRAGNSETGVALNIECGYAFIEPETNKKEG